MNQPAIDGQLDLRDGDIGISGDDGTLAVLLGACGANTIRGSGKRIRAIKQEAHTSAYYTATLPPLRFSPDGKLLATGFVDGTVVVMTVADLLKPE